MNKLDPADLALLSLYHGKYNTYKGAMLADIDELINLAEGFYMQYGNVEWDLMEGDGWEDTIIKHYNKYKLPNWSPIN